VEAAGWPRRIPPRGTILNMHSCDACTLSALRRHRRAASTAKSFTSALPGIAVDQGFLSSRDQNMTELFPELAPQATDPRKNEITIREMLQMRARRSAPHDPGHGQVWCALSQRR
jgi:hypothetical protein